MMCLAGISGDKQYCLLFNLIFYWTNHTYAEIKGDNIKLLLLALIVDNDVQFDTFRSLITAAGNKWAWSEVSAVFVFVSCLHYNGINNFIKK